MNTLANCMKKAYWRNKTIDKFQFVGKLARSFDETFPYGNMKCLSGAMAPDGMKGPKGHEERCGALGNASLHAAQRHFIWVAEQTVLHMAEPCFIVFHDTHKKHGLF